MTVAFKTALGTGLSTSSGTTVTTTTTAAIAIGDLVVVRVAADNLNATTPTFTCADGGNTYTNQRQGAVNATAAAGVAGAILTTRATVARASGSTITVTLSGAVAHKCVHAESFTGAENTVRSTAVSATGTATAASAPASGTVNAGDLVLGTIANETRGTITGDSDTTNGSWSTQVVHRSATSGTDSGCVSVAGQYKIATATGAQTYNVTAVAAEWVAMCVVLQATLVKEGAATAAHAWATSGSGRRVPKGAATVAHDVAIAASGTAPALLPVHARSLEANVQRTTEDAAERVLEAFTVAVPNEGAATAAHEWTTSSSGKRTPKGAATATHTWAATATGVAPTVDINEGTAAATWDETIAAAGKRTPKGTAAVAYVEATAATGRRVSSGTATAAYTFVTAGVGRRTPKGIAVTTHTWVQIAQGAAPAVGIKQGSALALHSWTSTAAGKRLPKASAPVVYLWTTGAVGRKPVKGSTAANWAVVTGASGKRFPKGTVIVDNVFALHADGIAPVTLIGYFTVAMQFGPHQVVAWQMNGQGAPVEVG